MLSQLVTSLNLNLPSNAAVTACACAAFWGQCCLGKLLPISSSAPSSTPLPLHSILKRLIWNPQSCILHLPHTKTHPHSEEVVLIDQDNPINLISLLKNHIHISSIPRDGLLFSFRESDNLIVLDKAFFLRHCNDVWQLLGHPRFTGHSFCIGGTTKLLIGIPPDVVRVTSCWSSESFLRYWRSLEDLAPHYTSNLPILAKRCNRFVLTHSRGYPVAGPLPSGVSHWLPSWSFAQSLGSHFFSWCQLSLSQKSLFLG